jgi:hypothetical protein
LLLFLPFCLFVLNLDVSAILPKASPNS